MLNCTDLACVLHHHHFYAHLHHLKHHLQEDNDNTPIGEGSDVDGSVQGLLNDTDSELSSLSHLDAPNEIIYIVCGVVIAMLLVGLIIILVAVTINKLRKREESSASPVSLEAPHQDHHHHNHHHHQLNNNNNSIHQQQQQLQLQQHQLQNNLHLQQNNNHSTQPQPQQQQVPAIAYRQSPASVWVFPPLPPQPNLFCTNSQDALIQFEKAGLKGFRKQFSGRFKRLVSRKPEPAPVIPPELKPQLKTIYVY